MTEKPKAVEGEAAAVAGRQPGVAGDAASESDRQQQAAMALLQAQSLGADKEQLQSQLEGWLQEDLETAMTALNI